MVEVEFRIATTDTADPYIHQIVTHLHGNIITGPSFTPGEHVTAHEGNAVLTATTDHDGATVVDIFAVTDGQLVHRWGRTYKSRSSARGRTVLRQLAAILPAGRVLPATTPQQDAKASLAVERARVADLTVIANHRTELSAKMVGPGGSDGRAHICRAHIYRETLTLSDGTLTTEYTVSVPAIGVFETYYTADDAWDEYRTYRWTKSGSVTRHSVLRCAHCRRPTTRPSEATDSSGIVQMVCGRCARHSRYELSFG